MMSLLSNEWSVLWENQRARWLGLTGGASDLRKKTRPMVQDAGLSGSSLGMSLYSMMGQSARRRSVL